VGVGGYGDTVGVSSFGNRAAVGVGGYGDTGTGTGTVGLGDIIPEVNDDDDIDLGVIIGLLAEGGASKPEMACGRVCTTKNSPSA